MLMLRRENIIITTPTNKLISINVYTYKYIVIINNGREIPRRNAGIINLALDPGWWTAHHIPSLAQSAFYVAPVGKFNAIKLSQSILIFLLDPNALASWKIK